MVMFEKSSVILQNKMSFKELILVLTHRGLHFINATADGEETYNMAGPFVKDAISN